MNKEKILLDALNTFGNFTSVEQEFNDNQLEVIYEAMNQVLRQPPVIISVCECKVCGKPFGDKLSLYEHYDEEHNKQTDI